MRWLAGAGLFALVGCNQIFGLSATQAFDGGPTGVLDRPHVALDWQIGTITPASGSTPAAPAPPTSAPISPAPKVRLATMTGAFTDATYAADGTIEIPRDYITQPWRLEYTLADGLVHEVQWKPDDKVGHIVVPIFGRPARDPVPAGAGYTLTPTTPPASYNFPRVFTMGLWTAGIAARPSTATLDYDFSNSVSLSGPLGAPDLAKGDQGLVIDYQIDGTGCRKGDGYAAFDPSVTGSHSVQAPAWGTHMKMITLGAVNTERANQISDLLGGSLPANLAFSIVGAIPSTDMPGLTAPPNNALLPTVLPNPVMIELLQCPLSVLGTISTALPDALTGFPLAEHIQIVGTRSVPGPASMVTLTSGMEAVALVSPTTGSAALSFPAPLPLGITLTPPGLAAIPLDDANPSEQNPVTAATGTFKLAFTPEAGLRGDYYDVVVHQIGDKGLTAERSYTILGLPETAPVAELSVSIDGAVLAAKHDYTFELRSYHGHPRASKGDLSTIDYPYGAAIVFSRTISVK